MYGKQNDDDHDDGDDDVIQSDQSGGQSCRMPTGCYPESVVKVNV